MFFPLPSEGKMARICSSEKIQIIWFAQPSDLDSVTEYITDNNRLMKVERTSQ